jgi:hypothetical protein
VYIYTPRAPSWPLPKRVVTAKKSHNLANSAKILRYFPRLPLHYNNQSRDFLHAECASGFAFGRKQSTGLFSPHGFDSPRNHKKISG